MTCAACLKRGKTWNGDDPVCSFPNGGEFSRAGWNCATADMIRDFCDWEDHPNVDYRYCNDQKYASIQVSDVEFPSGDALTLWVSWYKSRGRTDAMWLLSDDCAPRLPTEADCLAVARMLVSSARQKNDEIIEYYTGCKINRPIDTAPPAREDG